MKNETTAPLLSLFLLLENEFFIFKLLSEQHFLARSHPRICKIILSLSCRSTFHSFPLALPHQRICKIILYLSYLATLQSLPKVRNSSLHCSYFYICFGVCSRLEFPLLFLFLFCIFPVSLLFVLGFSTFSFLCIFAVPFSVRRREGLHGKRLWPRRKQLFFIQKGTTLEFHLKHNAKIWFFGPSFSRVTLWPRDKHLWFIHNGTPRYFHLWIYAKILRILPTFV